MGNAQQDRIHQKINFQNASTRNSVESDANYSEEHQVQMSTERSNYSITKNPIVQRRKLKQKKIKPNKLNLLTYEAFGTQY